MPVLYLPEMLYAGGAFRPGLGMLVDEAGTILRIGEATPRAGEEVVRLPGRAVLPGLVNAHSHSFQRLIRGAAEHRGPNGDDFWAWRNKMYSAAAMLEPEDLFAVARMAFLEMALSGITAVGEFHYVHRQPDGSPYADPNLLAKCVIHAAQSVGIRICLLRTAYFRAGYGLGPNQGQKRFYETCEEYLEAVARLRADIGQENETVSMGVAPHSVRAVPLAQIQQIAEWAAEHDSPCHMHVAEQTAEIAACQCEYGAAPIELLAKSGVLSERTTLVHAIHTAAAEVENIAAAGSTICACPTTERNLGDGIIDADRAIEAGIPFSLGSDSQANVDLLEDARELDHHLRLKRQRRVLLDQIDNEDLSARLFRYATAGGARSLGLNTGVLEAGRPADFFAVDLADVSIAGSALEELMPTILFSLERTAVSDVFMKGKRIVCDGKHAHADEIVAAYRKVTQRIR